MATEDAELDNTVQGVRKALTTYTTTGPGSLKRRSAYHLSDDGPMILSGARLILAGILCVVSTAALGQAEKPGKAPGYVASETCISCHPGAGDAWTSSHHARAWNAPTEHSVIGDFDDKTFEHRGVISRFSKGSGKFLVTTDGADGRSLIWCSATLPCRRA